MSRRDKLTPEPMNVYTWLLLAAMIFMAYGTFMLRKQLLETYDLEGMPRIMGMGDGMVKAQKTAGE